MAARYETAATLITSNLHPEEWEKAFANRLLGEATADRLQHRAYVIVLEGPSYRTPRPLGSGNETNGVTVTP